MKKGLLFFAIILPFIVKSATITSTGSGGNFNLGTSWVGGVVPGASDAAVVASGATITIDEDQASYTVLSLWIEDGATVNFTPSTSTTVEFNITNNLTIVLGGSFNSTSNTGVKQLKIGGDLVVDGVFDFDHTNAETYFNSTTDELLRGTGSTCNFQKLVVDKTTGTLEATRTFTIVTPVAGSNLEMTSGTLKISSATSIEPYGNALSSTINTASGNDAEIWLNHTSAVLDDNNASTTSLGLHMHVTAGTLSLGTGYTSSVFFRNGTRGKLTIDGTNAVVNVTGRLRFLDDNGGGCVFNMSDGELNIDPQSTNAAGVLFQIDEETELNLTGGTITLVNPISNSGGQDQPSNDFVLSGLGSTTKDFSGVTLSFGDGAASNSGDATKGGFTVDFPTGITYEIGGITMHSGLSTHRGVKFINTHNITLNTITLNAPGQIFNSNSSDFVVKNKIIPTEGFLFADTITFFADANGYAQLATGSGSVSSSGAVFMQYISRTDGGWVYLGFPVQATLADLDLGDTPKNYSGHIGENIFYFDASTSAWVAAPNASHSFDGRGFAIFMGDGAAFGTLPKTVSVHGSLITGNRNVTLAYNNSGSSQNDGWNLVSNPYPSNLDWENVKGSLTANTNNTVSLWNGTQYATYLSSGVNTNGGKRYIAPMQAFFVNVGSGGNGDVLGLTNSDRVVDSSASVMRTAPVEQIKLRVSKLGTDLSDETIVYFDANATDDFDVTYDAQKLKSTQEGVPNIYSIIAGTKNLSINAFTQLTEDKVVELGFENQTEGKHVIEMLADLVNPTWEVYLYDKQTENFHDLMKGSYTFSSTPGKNANRFSLHFSKKTNPTAINSTYVDFVSIKKYSNLLEFTFNNSLEGIANIEILNLLGQVVYENKIKINAENVLNISSFATGQLLLVRVTHGNQVFTQKIVR